MNINKRTTLAAAVLAACAMGVSGQAAAEAYVGSSLDLSNLTVSFSNQPSSLSYSFFVQNSATLNSGLDANQGTCLGSIGTTTTTTCATTGNVLAPGAVNGTGSSPARLDSQYALFGPNATDTYSNANSGIFTAELVNGVPTTGAAVANAQLAGTGTGQASTKVQSNTTLTFTIGGVTSLTLDYTLTPVLETLLNTPGLVPGSATGQASINANFVLTDASGLVTYATSAPTSLNKTANLPTVNGLLPVTYSPGAITDGFTVNGLAADQQYILNLNMGTAVSVTQTVPEPATPALMALGLVGMGATLRRRQIKRRRKQV